MNRTVKNRLIQLLTVTLIAVIAFAFLYMSGGSFWLFFVIAFFVLLPGRLQSHYWKDYYEGQQLLRKRKHLDAIVRFQRFLEFIKKRPELKKLVWMTPLIYTRDVEVMALSNLGVCHLWLGELDDAEKCLNSAAKIDPESPLPFFNLALVYQTKDNEARASENLDKAEELGFRRSRIKKVRKSLLEDEAETEDETA